MGNVVQLVFFKHLQVKIDFSEYFYGMLSGFFTVGIEIDALVHKIAGSAGLNDGKGLLPEALPIGPPDQIDERNLVPFQYGAKVFPNTLGHDREALFNGRIPGDGKIVLHDIPQAFDAALQVGDVAQGYTGINVPHTVDNPVDLRILQICFIPVIYQEICLSIAKECSCSGQKLGDMILHGLILELMERHIENRRLRYYPEDTDLHLRNKCAQLHRVHQIKHSGGMTVLDADN